MPNYCVIICSACDANTTAQNSLLSYPPILSVDERDHSCDANIKHVMQMRLQPPISTQLMHLMHHNITSRAWRDRFQRTKGKKLFISKYI